MKLEIISNITSIVLTTSKPVIASTAPLNKSNAKSVSKFGFRTFKSIVTLSSLTIKLSIVLLYVLPLKPDAIADSVGTTKSPLN